jgi:hypothetical protein
MTSHLIFTVKYFVVKNSKVDGRLSAMAVKSTVHSGKSVVAPLAIFVYASKIFPERESPAPSADSRPLSAELYVIRFVVVVVVVVVVVIYIYIIIAHVQIIYILVFDRDDAKKKNGKGDRGEGGGGGGARWGNERRMRAGPGAGKWASIPCICTHPCIYIKENPSPL